MNVSQQLGSGPARKYRWKWWALLPSLLTCAYTVPMLSILIGIFIYNIARILQQENIGLFGVAAIAVLGVFLVPFALFWMWFVALPIGRVFFSYLKVAPEGVEYRYWPSYAIRCNWDDVESLGEHRSLGVFPSDVLNLKRGEPIGPQITTTLRSRLGLKTQYFVPLTGIRGWPDGQLANDLRHYIPHILESKDSGAQLEN